MKLEKELKRSLGLGTLNRLFLCFLSALIAVPAYADPIINDVPLPPASFTRVDDRDLLISLGLDPGPAYCYDVDANAIIITAPARERAKCELRLMYEEEKQKVKHDFEISKLKLRISTLTDQHDAINLIRDKEIERLTTAAAARPNDNRVWYATGGFFAGAATVLGIFFLVK